MKASLPYGPKQTSASIHILLVVVHVENISREASLAFTDKVPYLTGSSAIAQAPHVELKYGLKTLLIKQFLFLQHAWIIVWSFGNLVLQNIVSERAFRCNPLTLHTHHRSFKCFIVVAVKSACMSMSVSLGTNNSKASLGLGWLFLIGLQS